MLVWCVCASVEQVFSNSGLLADGADQRSLRVFSVFLSALLLRTCFSRARAHLGRATKQPLSWILSAPKIRKMYATHGCADGVVVVVAVAVAVLFV